MQFPKRCNKCQQPYPLGFPTDPAIDELSTRARAIVKRFNRMIEAVKTMPPDALERLEEWEGESLDGRAIATSDWPEWSKFVDMSLEASDALGPH